MKDLTFKKFRNQLKAAVKTKLAAGDKVGNASKKCMPDVYCPLGCHPQSFARNPFESSAAMLWGIPLEAATAFINAFDEGFSDGSPYAALGLQYRAKYH